MLHLYDTRGEYLDIGENNFCVREELQHNRIFGAEGTWEGEGKKRKYICPLGTWTHRRAIWSVILMLAKHLNTTLNTQG